MLRRITVFLLLILVCGCAQPSSQIAQDTCLENVLEYLEQRKDVDVITYKVIGANITVVSNSAEASGYFSMFHSSLPPAESELNDARYAVVGEVESTAEASIGKRGYSAFTCDRSGNILYEGTH